MRMRWPNKILVVIPGGYSVKGFLPSKLSGGGDGGTVHSMIDRGPAP